MKTSSTKSSVVSNEHEGFSQIPHVSEQRTFKAVFLDKDGTLIKNVPYNVNPNYIEFCAGALESLRMLHAAGYKLFIITNQSGVARGLFPESALAIVEQHLQNALTANGTPLAGFYYCPHHPEGTISSWAIACTCRKPQPGLIQQAAREHQIDLSKSWFIGDILHDVEAGLSAGCRTVLINNGNETEWQLSPQRLPHHVVNNLVEAAQVITALDPKRFPLSSSLNSSGSARFNTVSFGS